MQSVYKLVANTSEFDAKIRKSKQNLTQFANNGKLGMEGFTKAIGGSIASMVSWTAVIAGAAKVVGDIVRTNKEFEQSNANLAAVLGTTRDNITALTEDAKKLGASTMYTASQVTSLQTELAKLGFNQSEIKNATKDVLNFAAATGADLGGSAALCGAALRSWGLDAKDMGRVASSMAVATSKSALSYEKLAGSLDKVAPVASKFGFSIEDTLAILGKLSDAGMDASSAATAARNIFLYMADSSGKLAQALGRPIKSLDDLAPALGELQARGIDLAEMLNLTDKRAVTAFATLVSGNSSLIDLRNSITDCSDALQGMVDTQMNTLEGSTKIMQSAWEGLMLTFSNSNGILKGVTDSLGKFLSQWAQWRALNNGGEGAIASMEKGLSPQQQKEIEASLKYRQEMGLGGKDLDIAKATKEKYEKERDEIKKTYDLWLKRHEMIKKESGAVNNAEFAPIKGMSNTMDVNEDFAKKIAAKNDLIAQEQFKIDYLSPKAATQAAEETAKAVETAEQKLTTRILAIKNQEAKDIAAIDREKFKTEEEYENEVYRIKRESLLKQRALYSEGGDKYIQTDTAIANLDINHQAKLNRGGKSNSQDLSLLEQRNQKIQQVTDSMEEMQSILDSNADANTKAWATEQLQSYQSELDKLNGKVTETTQNISKSVPDAMANFSTGLNAVSSMVGAFDGVKNSVEGMIDTLNSDADAYSKTMSVFSAGMSVLQGMVTIYETINTLKGIFSTLSMANVAAQQAETTAVVAGTAAEVTATTTQTSADAVATGVKAGKASASAGDAVAGIPIVGPILAVAAIAAVLAAVLAAVSKAKSGAGSYAEGGIIPGTSFSGDNLTANVNSGELILNRAQQASIAGQLQQGSNIANGTLSTRIKGGDILIALDNTNRARGGSRGTYAYSK